tara:strand:+ start:459 stop:668 length:210 start_codon:yes stop_codon:yes gene_type:complete
MTDKKQFWNIENTEEEMLAEGWRVNGTYTHMIGAAVQRHNLMRDHSNIEVVLASGATEGEIKVMTRIKG